MPPDGFDKLATIDRPSCPKCNHPLGLGRVSPGSAGFHGSDCKALLERLHAHGRSGETARSTGGARTA
jgi:hypothetical protein